MKFQLLVVVICPLHSVVVKVNKKPQIEHLIIQNLLENGEFRDCVITMNTCCLFQFHGSGETFTGLFDFSFGAQYFSKIEPEVELGRVLFVCV